jgi:superfamily II DNA or RNA helicase
MWAPPDASTVFLPNEAPVGRASMNAWVRSTIHELEDLVRLSEQEYTSVYQQMRSVLSAKREFSVHNRLANTSVDALRGQAANLKIAAVVAAGVMTAADVTRLGVGGLMGLPNVGEHTAQSLYESASRVALPRRDDLRPRMDPRTWDRVDQGLVNALRILQVVGPLLGLPHVQAVKQLIEALRLIEKATGFGRWLLAGKASRAATQHDYANASRLRDSGEFRSHESALRSGNSESQRLRSNGFSLDDLRRDWSINNANFMTLLERVVQQLGDGRERAAATDGLTGALRPELVRRIEAQPLDLTLCGRTLRGYQSFGARFALVVGRGLLGDDMGLGKTIQALAVIGHVSSGEGLRHHVVVCPASLVDNWLRETEMTLPSVPAIAYRNPGRVEAFQDWKALGGVLVASFEQASTGLCDEPLPEIGVLVVDEAHYAKNPEAKRTQAVIQLLLQSRRALLMSGTMLENRASELIHLTGMANRQVAQQLRRQFGQDGEDAFYRHDEFKAAIGGVYLRRNQSEVLDELPDVVMTDEVIEVGEDERGAYRSEISANNLMRARRALSVGGGQRSKKIQRIGEIANDCRTNGQKLLVFSSFTDVVNAVDAEIGGDCEIIDGAVPQRERQVRLDRLRDTVGFRALSMQIDVGSVGLNIQAASVIVLVEPQYKPSTEAQAIARAHRMGQTSTVLVYRLIAPWQRVIQDLRCQPADRRPVDSGIRDEAFEVA